MHVPGGYDDAVRMADRDCRSLGGVLVSDTVLHEPLPAHVRTEPRGAHRLKGVPGTRELARVERASEA